MTWGVELGDNPTPELEISGVDASLVFEVKCREYSFYGNVSISGYGEYTPVSSCP